MKKVISENDETLMQIVNDDRRPPAQTEFQQSIWG